MRCDSGLRPATGIADAARLLEELPNKIRDLLGIIVEVNLRSERDREFIEVVTPAYPSPISYRHQSQPPNPDIANAFFRACEIEAWGRGIERIFAACREAATPAPRIRLETGGLWMEFPFADAYLRAVGPAAGHQPITETGGKSSGKSSGKTEDRILATVKKEPGLWAAIGRSCHDGTLPTMARGQGRVERAAAGCGGVERIASRAQWFARAACLEPV